MPEIGKETATTDAGDQPAAQHLRNHLIWVGPLVVFSGAVSYFLFFAKFPALRDFPWINLPWILAGLGICAAAVWRAWRARSPYRGRILGTIGLAVSCFLAGMFGWYVFVYSYSVPVPKPVTLAMEQAPNFALRDTQGRQVELTDFRGQKVILLFYRGHW